MLGDWPLARSNRPINLHALKFLILCCVNSSLPREQGRDSRARDHLSWARTPGANNRESHSHTHCTLGVNDNVTTGRMLEGDDKNLIKLASLVV